MSAIRFAVKCLIVTSVKLPRGSLPLDKMSVRRDILQNQTALEPNSFDSI